VQIAGCCFGALLAHVRDATDALSDTQNALEQTPERKVEAVNA
jgi:hypothetical protein